jgi:ABC-2 type transport system ATP-binding protein
MLSIQIEGLKKSFKKTQALDGVQSTFGAGLMHGLIGPEGAGKTTLLRHIMGLLKPDDGKIHFYDDGKDIDFESVRPNIAYMPQRQSLYADLSIEEHLLFFKDLYGLPSPDFKEKSKRLLEITRLEKYLDRPAGKLSGGMYKKLGLMCALLASPKILLLDEPTNGVDPISRREFWELLYQLASEKILIIMATAYMDEAERCSEVHLIDSGKIIGEGEPRALLSKVGARSFDEYFLKSEKSDAHANI